MPRLEESFNRSGFSRFLNSPSGRIFRLAAGLGFLAIGFIFRGHTLGVVSMVWGVFPLTAGALDICYISALLGGPLSGKKIRAEYQTG
ncbi:MAG: YgaP-like transmembrane domain [Candidatus Aminicenantales bacterium]